jgi:hypothetical protein
MTDDERNEEGVEELVEDLEASATAQAEVAGGIGKCGPTNACSPVDSLVHCREPTQLCLAPTCLTTVVKAL